jgi:hypothetical protein
MSLLNLGLTELLALLGTVSGLVLALYLLDRSRKRQVVATLRFWAQANSPAPLRRKRRKIHQRLSLFLQLVSLALLLLAIAQPRFGSRERKPRDHVLILDTSSWMQARTSRGALMEEARALAFRWLAGLPSSDRVMLVRADALATPATGFESDHRVVEKAIAASEPSQTALDIGKALELAERVQRLHSSSAGEVAYVGAGRIAGGVQNKIRRLPSNLLVLLVDREARNCGLRTISVRRSATDPSLWEMFLSVKNYNPTATDVSVAVLFGGAPVGVRRLHISPAGEQNTIFLIRTRAAGWLEARLFPGDGFPADDHAVLELPQQKILRVTVYSNHAEWLKPLLAANRYVSAKFRKPSDYKPQEDSDVAIFDRFTPQTPPASDSIWIQPPRENPIFKVVASVAEAPVTRWCSENLLAAGLRTADLRVRNGEVFAPEAGDIPVAEVAQGPVILARPGKPKLVALGFHPMLSRVRYELATPLLFANILGWFAPQIFQHWELNAGNVGSVTVPLAQDTDLSEIRVTDASGAPLPFTIRGQAVRLFSGNPGIIRVMTGGRELVNSLTLPDVADTQWAPPQSARHGLSNQIRVGTRSRDWWQVLALAGGLGLLIEWLLFGQRRASPQMVLLPRKEKSPMAELEQRS